MKDPEDENSIPTLAYATDNDDERFISNGCILYALFLFFIVAGSLFLAIRYLLGTRSV